MYIILPFIANLYSKLYTWRSYIDWIKLYWLFQNYTSTCFAGSLFKWFFIISFFTKIYIVFYNILWYYCSCWWEGRDICLTLRGTHRRPKYAIDQWSCVRWIKWVVTPETEKNHGQVHHLKSTFAWVKAK